MIVQMQMEIVCTIIRMAILVILTVYPIPSLRIRQKDITAVEIQKCMEKRILEMQEK